MLQRRFRIIQVGEVTIVNQNIHCRQEPQVAHPGQDEAKQKVPFGFTSIPCDFIWFRRSRPEVNIGIANAKGRAIVKALTTLLVIRKNLQAKLICKGRM